METGGWGEEEDINLEEDVEQNISYSNEPKAPLESDHDI